MPDATQFQFNIPSVPRAYEKFLVPTVFEPWAMLLLDALEPRAGESVLDVATGPGTVARLAAVRVGPRGRVLAIDIAQPMLDIAKAKPLPQASAEIDYQLSPATPLPSASAEFDVVLCQQGLQFFPDRIGALREMRRVLKPGGRVGIAVWVEIDRNQLYAAYHVALRACVPAQLSDLIVAPFSWPSGSALESVAGEAGFRDIRLSTCSLPMVLEAGVEQAVQTFAGTPVAPDVAKLPQEVQNALFDRMRQEMTKLLKNGKVVAVWTSNIMVGYA